MLNKSPSTKNFYNYGFLSDNYFHIRERVILDEKLNQKIKMIRSKDSVTKIAQNNQSLKYWKGNLNRNGFNQSPKNNLRYEKPSPRNSGKNLIFINKSPVDLSPKSNYLKFKNEISSNSNNLNSIIANFRKLKSKSFASKGGPTSFKKQLPPLNLAVSPSNSNFFVTSGVDCLDEDRKPNLEDISIKKYIKNQNVSQIISLENSLNENWVNQNNNKIYNFNRHKRNKDPLYTNISHNKINSSFHKLNNSLSKMNLSSGSFRSSSSHSISREKAKEIKSENIKFKQRLERVHSPLNKESLLKSASAQAKIGQRIKRVKPLSHVFQKISSIKVHMNGVLNFNNLKFDKKI